MSNSDLTSSAAHVLLVPYPAQGHIIPLLDFAHHLARRRLAVITIVVTPKNLPLLDPLLNAHPDSVATLVLPFPTHPTIPAGVENTIALPAGSFGHMMCALAALRDPISDWFHAHPSPPLAIIADMFMGWTHNLAHDLGIRSYAFFPSGAFAMSFVYSLWREMPEQKDGDDNGNEIVGFAEIPNSPSYPWWQLSPVFRSYVTGDPDSEFIRESFLANFEKSHGLVFNTFHALEGVYSDYLSTVLAHNRVWSVGPVFRHDDGGRGGPSSVLTGQIRAWLDTCGDHSVVYVCFGSQAVLTNKQMKELSSGLERSGVRFILSVKGPTNGHDESQYGAVPTGFEGRVAGRGVLIRGWAPQGLILRHRAVGAFLTHCGWNSVLESIAAGVPMLAWPMSADQFLNATLLVEQLGVAVRVCEGAAAVLESQELVAQLAEVTGDKWRERRARAAALSKAVVEAVSDGGSSFHDLGDLSRCFSAKE